MKSSIRTLVFESVWVNKEINDVIRSRVDYWLEVCSWFKMIF